jgi:DNA-binding response OmpR family regulator
MRLLLVEDYAPLRRSLAKGLAEAGFAVDAAADGEAGLFMARSSAYDVIILDLMLPALSGLDLLRRLRADGGEAHVLILTAKGEAADRVHGLNTGADDYLVKPFAFDELLARIRALLRRSYRRKNPVISVDVLRIDTAAQRVWRAGEEIDLTAREYALLEYLAIRRGEVVSRTDIWNHLYDWISTATSNVVDVYVSLLRKKLDVPGVPSVIETVRGRGYALGRREA